MSIWTRRLLTAGVVVGALAAGACGRVDATHQRDETKAGVVDVASACPGKPEVGPRPDRSWASETIVLDGEVFTVRMPRDWDLIDEGDHRGDAYALVRDDLTIGVALAGGASAYEVRDVAELAVALDSASDGSPVRFAGGRGCHHSLDGQGPDRYEVWLDDGDRAIAAIAVGIPDDAAAWRDAQAIVASIEKVDA